MSDLLAQGKVNLAAGDFPALRVVGHTIKGLSANAGLENMRDLGLDLQLAADATNAASSHAIIEKITAAMDELR